MSGQDKTIRVGMAGDQQSFRNTQRLIRETEADLKKLGDTAEKVTKQMGGGAKFGGAGGAGAGGAGGAGGGNAPGAAGGAAGGISKLLNEQKQLFRTIADASKSALQATTVGLRDEAARQQTIVRNLKRDLDGLAKSYTQLKAAGAGPGELRAARGKFSDAHADLAGAQAEDMRLRMQFHQTRAASGGPGAWNSRAQLMSQGIFGDRNDPASGMVGRTMMRLGVPADVLRYGGPLAAGAAVGYLGVGAVKAGITENATAPWDLMRRTQMQTGTAQGIAMGIRGGDFTFLHADRLIRASRGHNASSDAIAGGLRQTPVAPGTERFGDAPYGQRVKARLGELWGGVKSGLSMVVPNMSSSGGVGFDAGDWRRDKALEYSPLDPLGAINRTKRRIDDIPAEGTKEYLDYRKQYIQARPLDFTADTHFQANYQQDISNMKGLGMGAGRMRQGQRVNHAVNAARALTERGLLGEGTSAFQGIEGIAGRQAGHQGYSSVAGALAGGLYGGAQIYGQGALGGTGGGFFQATQNYVGRGSGGIDVAAANRMGMTASSALMSGSGMTSGLGMLGAMGAYARGGNSAQDMLRQQFMPQGLEAMGTVFGGTLDPYQQGSNLLSAIQSAPTAGVWAQEYLSRLDYRQVLDIMANPNDLPADLKAHGITAEMVQKYAPMVLARLQDRNIGLSPGQGGAANPMQAMNQVVKDKYGGDFGKYVKGEGLSGVGLDNAFSNRGAFLESVGAAKTFQGGASMARVEAGMGTAASATRQAGRGAYNPAAGSTQLKNVKSLSDFEKEDELTVQGNAAQYEGDIKGRKRSVEDIKGMGELGQPIEAVKIGLDRLVHALEIAADRISGGRRKFTVGQAGPVD